MSSVFTGFLQYLKNDEVSSRIVGGNKIPISKAPYAVALVDDAGNFCTGTLIHSRWVVTAAHCCDRRTPTYIRIGSESGSDGGQLYRVKEMVIHPCYKPKTFDCDVAVIKLNKDVPFSDTVQPATLSAPNEEIPVGKVLTVSGYGDTNSFWDAFYQYKNKNKLRSVDVPVVSQHYCRQAYPGRITRHMLCAGYPEGKQDACSGDSGGPLTDGAKLFGVVSWGRGCGLPNSPGVYGRVSAFHEWIKEITGI